MSAIPFNPLAAIGRSTIAFLSGAGRIAIFGARGTAAILQPPFYGREFLRALLFIGYYSLPVVGLTAIFTGGALALQTYAGGARFNGEQIVPTIVAIGIVRELGPVLGGLMVAGRVAAAIAAEIGTMKVTEQIDALVTLSTNPMKYLVAPRLLAAVFALPLLVAVADVLGIFGGWLVGITRLDFNSAVYLKNTADFLEAGDVISGLVKAAVFGFIIALMGSYQGMHSGRGASGVGRATTLAVVTASVLILASNYLLTEFFFSS